MTTAPDHTTTTLSTIVVEKPKLLETLRDNRAKHAAIYEAASAGYWIKTKEVLEERRTLFTKAVADSTTTFTDKLAEANTVFDKQYVAFAAAVEAKAREKLTTFDTSKSSGGWSVIANPHWVPELPTHHLDEYDRTIRMLEFSVADKVTLSLQDFESYVQNNWAWASQFVASNRGYVQAVTGALYARHGESYLNSASHMLAISGCVVSSTSSRL